MESKLPRRKSYDRLMMSSTHCLLRWADKDNRGISSSGWSFRDRGHVHFRDETSVSGKITLIVEPPTPFNPLSHALASYESFWYLKGQNIELCPEAHGYFFEKNTSTGKIDLLHRLKPFNGKEERNLYRDCTYFGITLELRKDSYGVIWEERMFTLTSGYSDKLFPIGVNVSPSWCTDFSIMVAAVNVLIDSVQEHIEIAANARVYRLFCTGLEYDNQCREYETGVLNHKYEDDCGPYGTDSTGNIINDGRDISEIPYYVKISDIQIMKDTGMNDNLDGCQKYTSEVSNDVIAIHIDSSKIAVDCRL